MGRQISGQEKGVFASSPGGSGKGLGLLDGKLLVPLVDVMEVYEVCRGEKGRLKGEV